MRAGPGLKTLVRTIRLTAFRFQCVGKVSPGDPAFVRVHDDVLLTGRANSRPLRQKRTWSCDEKRKAGRSAETRASAGGLRRRHDARRDGRILEGRATN